MLENVFLYSDCCKDRWILTKPSQIYLLEISKHSLDFGVLDPIFKVTRSRKMFKCALSKFYIPDGWKDFKETFIEDGKEPIGFW